jgi:hypothetical protein
MSPMFLCFSFLANHPRREAVSESGGTFGLNFRLQSRVALELHICRDSRQIIAFHFTCPIRNCPWKQRIREPRNLGLSTLTIRPVRVTYGECSKNSPEVWFLWMATPTSCPFSVVLRDLRHTSFSFVQFAFLRQLKQFPDPASDTVVLFRTWHSSPALKFRLSGSLPFGDAHHSDRFVFLRRLKALATGASPIAILFRL